ncbi:hypothetical protein [Niabella beijingensis]|uniref:hypothetical protein n=1 Tax=Niabella beijingensis TaxID=2872700 RepID=UPI001CC07DED|nr:hypothetical protein [Niabella beijingensis]MBZ4191898.1 hypothetical protein [Niabella beijingensis]
MKSTRNLRAFFENYAAANDKNDLSLLTTMYAADFIAAGPEGHAVFKNDESFLEWLQQLQQQQLRSGLQQLRILRFAEARISDSYSQVSITWGAVFEKTGEEPVPFDITYYVHLSREGPRIIMYISHEDEAVLRKEKGLL